MPTQIPLVRTKIRAPRLRRELLRRDRLVNYIHANIQHKLILISAGAGYGKTSMLIAWAHDAEMPVCWVSLDAGDANALTFAAYLVAAIHERFPAFGQSVRDYLAAEDHAAEDVEPLVRLLVDEIERNTDAYFCVVLDDYHAVVDSEPVNALVDGLLRHLPEQCHFILASRAIPRRLTLTRLAARQEVVGIGVDELRFTPAEVAQMLALLGYADLPAEQVSALAERTGGWITGLLLAAQAHRSGATREIVEISGASAGVFDYMAAEILARQPAETQRFLLGSALYREMSPALCDALLGTSSAAQMLRDLADANLFTISLDAEGAWYQYHDLFREFLVTKFERDDPAGYRALRLRQAGLMAHRGDWPAAIASYVQAGAWEQAADALAVIAHGSFGSGQWDQLKAWIDALPPTVLDRYPTLMLFRAKVHTEAGELDPSLALLARCRRACVERQDAIGEARALTQVAVVQRYRGLLQAAIATGTEALGMARDRDPLTAVQASREVGICHCMLGQYGKGLEELGAALDLARSSADEVNAAYIALDMGTAEMSQGHLLDARRLYHQALLYWRRVGNPGNLALTLQNLGTVDHYLGQYGEAEARFQEALSKARAVGDNRTLAYALASLADLYRDTQRYDEATAQYQLAEQAAAGTQLAALHVYVLSASADALRLQGRLPLARRTVTEALDEAHPQEMPYESGLCYLSAGALSFAEGNLPAAQEALERARTLLEAVAARRDSARAHLYLTATALAREEAPAMAPSIRAVARLAGELGTTQFLVAEAPAIRDLLRRLARDDVHGLDIGEVLAEAERLGTAGREEPSRRYGSAPPEVEFRALDGGLIVRQGQPVTQWESAAARHLAFLLAIHPDGLHRERAIALLWPELNEERGNSLFHSTLYRVRLALGKDAVVRRSGVFALSPALSPWSDVAEFEALASQGDRQGEVAHAARARAIALYRTPFLPTMEGDWSRERRESLHTTMVNLLIREARYLASREDTGAAEALFLRAWRMEPYDERAHRGIIWCRASRGDRAGAIRVYRQCARTLRGELGVEPSAETRELHRTVLSEGRLPPLG